MTPRIELDERAPESALITPQGTEPSPFPTRQLVDVDWENTSAEPLMLYVAEEPRIGLEFSYHGLNWRIVDYRDGWIAELLVD